MFPCRLLYALFKAGADTRFADGVDRRKLGITKTNTQYNEKDSRGRIPAVCPVWPLYGLSRVAAPTRVFEAN